MNQWWSWILTIVGVSGLYFAGKKLWFGWLIGLSAQVLWLAYAITTRQWGFLVSVFAYGAVYAKNLYSWLHPVKEKEEQEQEEEEEEEVDV